MPLQDQAGTDPLPDTGRTIEPAVRFLEATPERWFTNSRIPRLIHHTWLMEAG